MKSSLMRRLETLLERHEELSALLSDPGIIADQARFRDYSREYAQLDPLVNVFRQYQECRQNVAGAREMLNEEEAELRAMAQQELDIATAEEARLEQALQVLLLPKDPLDDSAIYLEIRAGAGGDEAAIFAGDLCRMYTRYAQSQRWEVEMVHASAGEHGGYREVILRIPAEGAYSRFKFESGVHRVQRVPETEAQGRVHTSTCTVAVLPEVEEVSDIVILPTDLRIDTFRASGAGGQHVQKTDSAIRITHIPTGLVVECQDERSQHKNRARAMSILKSKLLLAERSRQQQEEAETRRNLVGTGDRSERIRTYNFPQGRVTDHRINLTLYRLPVIIEGDLDELMHALIHEYQADLLAGLSSE